MVSTRYLNLSTFNLTLFLQNLTLDTDAQFLWRFAKSVHQKTLSASDVEVKKVHAFRAKELAFQALGSSSGDAIPDVHKWLVKVGRNNLQSLVGILSSLTIN